MIVDGHVHITDIPEPVWGWQPFGGDDLVDLMDQEMRILGRERVVDHAAVMPALGITTDHELTFREQHQTVIDAVKKYPGRLVGTFVLNPRQGVEKGIEELRRLVRDDDFRMIKLHPTMHHFWPKDKKLVYPILEEAKSLGVPVLIHMGEPPYSIPSLVEQVALDNPDVTIILAHLGTQKICYADDAVNVARHCPNVMLETGWGPLPRLLEALRTLGPERLVFGSDCPPQDIFSQLRPIECLTWKPPLGENLSPEGMEMIMGDNMARLLKLGA
jgi:predicted TIM-barrel fold metal-dependent hydrolase